MIRAIKDWGDAAKLSARLKERVTIERSNETSDAQGGVTRSWSSVTTCFAEVTPLYTDGAERIDMDRPATQMQYRVVIRAGMTADNTMRIQWNAKTLNIRAVVALPTHLEIIAEEGVAL